MPFSDWLSTTITPTLWIILLAITLTAYAFRPYVNLSQTGLPFPRPVYPFFGNAPIIYRNGFQGAQIIWQQALGRVYAVAQGQTLVVAVSDPGLLKQILVRCSHTFINRRSLPPVNRYIQRSLFLSQGEEWKRARRIMGPTFTSHKIKSHMFPASMRCAKTTVGHLQNLMESSGSSNITKICAKDHFDCFTIDVIALVAFGLDLDSHKDGDNDFVKDDYLQLLIEANDNYSSASNIIQKSRHNDTGDLPSANNHDPDATINFNQTEHKGLHTNMMKLEDDQKPDLGSFNLPDGLSEEDVIANSILFFLAGYETTSTALSWISRMLAWYPEVQGRVREELHAKIRQRVNNDAMKDDAYQHLTYEDIMDLPYMDCVIKEVLRLHAPPLIFDRIALEDTFLEKLCPITNKTGAKGQTKPNEKLFIPKGTIIEIPVYALHRDKDLWPNPNTFNPDRFIKDSGEGVDNKYQYMPFGYGPRSCLGQRFALLEMKICLAAILGAGIQFVRMPKDFREDLTPENTKFRIAGINYPRDGIRVGLTSYADNYKKSFMSNQP